MLDILDRAAMADCKPCSTLVDTNPKLAADGPLVKDASYFCSLAGAFQYLTFTRPNIAYTVQQVCLHMHDSHEPHLIALKRILLYIRGTLHLGLVLRPSTQSESSTPILIGPVAVIHASPPQATRCSSVTTVLVVKAVEHGLQVQC